MLSPEKTKVSEIDKEEVLRLRKIARDLRIKIINMLAEAGSGHPGGSLSAIDIITTIYFHFMKIDPKNPKWPERDRFVLSKGHAAPALYSVLATLGFFDEKELMTLRKFPSKLQGHPDKLTTPGVDMSTGSLGQGLSVSTGMALGARLDKKDIRIFTVCSDGEHQSGMTWEAVLSAAKFKLDNMTVFIDNNGLQIDGRTDTIMPVMPLKEKYLAFNWNVYEVDGHDIEAIIEAAYKAIAHKGQPSVIICKTIKGKGVSFMEDQVSWHGVAPSMEEAAKAIEELKAMEIK
ncbi:MAG: transketolase [Acidobacteria bacterium]|nr:transketolase [Acidobacteriota bacterium]